MTLQQSKELKHQLLNDGSFKKYKQFRKLTNKLKVVYSYEEIDENKGLIYKVPTFEYYQLVDKLEQELINDIGLFGFQQCQQIENNGYNRVGRLRKRTENLLANDKDAYFITLTFNDEYLEKLNDKTKRVMVSRVLKAHCLDYVANVDYGGDYDYIDNKGTKRTATARIHFHALTDNPIKPENWRYGFSSCIKVRKSNKQDKLRSISSLPPYLDKLTKHAIKQTTNRIKPIYSKRTNKGEKL